MYSQFGHPLQVGKQPKISAQYEMGYTPKEFQKTLTGLFITQTPYACEELSPHHWQIMVEGESITVDIKIKEAPPRVIALLKLPVLQVTFEFANGSDETQESFKKIFFKFFHKGGG